MPLLAFGVYELDMQSGELRRQGLVCPMVMLTARTNKMDEVLSIRLYYRHANQAERFNITEMHVAETQRKNGVFRETLSGTYTASNYPLQYYFELKQGPERASLYPGFTAELTGQPYFVLRAT